MSKKDKIDPQEVANLPVYVPDPPTKKDKATEYPAPVEHVRNGRDGNVDQYNDPRL